MQGGCLIPVRAAGFASVVRLLRESDTLQGGPMSVSRRGVVSARADVLKVVYGVE
jgi:hypothetical protein